MSDAVLVLNSGSSSIKFGLFDIAVPERTCFAKACSTKHDAKPRLNVSDASGNKLVENHRPAAGNGGRDFVGPVEVTDAVIAALAALTPLAPLHQPRCLSPMRTIRSLRPDLTQIAWFDTAFHHGLAPPASRFAIPRRFEEIGIRRSGFHGLWRPRGGRRLPQKTAAGRLF